MDWTAALNFSYWWIYSQQNYCYKNLTHYYEWDSELQLDFVVEAALSALVTEFDKRFIASDFFYPINHSI